MQENFRTRFKGIKNYSHLNNDFTVRMPDTMNEERKTKLHLGKRQIDDHLNQDLTITPLPYHPQTKFLGRRLSEDSIKSDIYLTTNQGDMKDYEKLRSERHLGRKLSEGRIKRDFSVDLTDQAQPQYQGKKFLGRKQSEDHLRSNITMWSESSYEGLSENKGKRKFSSDIKLGNYNNYYNFRNVSHLSNNCLPITNLPIMPYVDRKFSEPLLQETIEKPYPKLPAYYYLSATPQIKEGLQKKEIPLERIPKTSVSSKSLIQEKAIPLENIQFNYPPKIGLQVRKDSFLTQPRSPEIKEGLQSRKDSFLSQSNVPQIKGGLQDRERKFSIGGEQMPLAKAGLQDREKRFVYKTKDIMREGLYDRGVHKYSFS